MGLGQFQPLQRAGGTDPCQADVCADPVVSGQVVVLRLNGRGYHVDLLGAVDLGRAAAKALVADDDGIGGQHRGTEQALAAAALGTFAMEAVALEDGVVDVVDESFGEVANKVQLPSRQQFALQDHQIGGRCRRKAEDPRQTALPERKGLELKPLLEERRRIGLKAVAIADVLRAFNQGEYFHRRQSPVRANSALWSDASMRRQRAEW